jgi:hypothetical protein
MNLTPIRHGLWAGVVAAAMASASAYGQSAVTFNVPGPATWSDDNNWSTLLKPEAQFSEFAVIGSGYSAFVDDMPPAVGGVTMGAGTLEIQSTGNLSVVAGGLNSGSVILGSGGGSNLSVRRGGTLTADSIASSGGAATQLVLGETTGSGTANLSVVNATLGAVTRIVGNTANFSVSGDLGLGSSSILVPEITGLPHSAINVTGAATLGGTVRPEFNGYAPMMGDSWTLVTAGSVSGTMTVDASAAPALARGTAYHVNTTATNAALTLTNELLLTVSRLNGTTKIENVIGAPISLDGYTISSASGALDGTWNSLQTQAIAGWDEADNSSAQRLTEFNPTGSSSVSVGAPLSLGTPFQPAPPATLGEPVGTDLTFQYTTPSGQIQPGKVEYSGPLNNLVLTIDPATGQARLQNESHFFNATIDAYTITSASGLLKPSNGNWNSLQDQGLGSWDEADNSSSNRVTEFNPLGVTFLGGGGTILTLGGLVDVSGGAPAADDLALRFTLSDGTELDGIVTIGALPTPGLAGDVNYDNIVNIFDINLVSAKWNTAGPPGDANHDGIVNIFDINLISANWNAMGGAGAATAVPEPSSAGLALLAVVSLTVAWGSRYKRPAR